MKLEELIELCEKHEACLEAIEWLKTCKDMKQVEEECSPKDAWWLRSEIADLPDDIKCKAELKACESPTWAYWLRRDVTDLPEDVKRKAELKVCEDSYWACHLKRKIEDLHPDTIKELEKE